VTFIVRNRAGEAQDGVTGWRSPQKKSKHSIATLQKEIELIRARLRWAERLHAAKTEEG
jgi:hypothetical protein